MIYRLQKSSDTFKNSWGEYNKNCVERGVGIYQNHLSCQVPSHRVVSHTWLCTWASACSFHYGLGASLLSLSVALLVYQSWPSISDSNFAYQITHQTCLPLLHYLELKQHAPCFCQVWHYSAEFPTPQWCNKSGCNKDGKYFSLYFYTHTHKIALVLYYAVVLVVPTMWLALGQVGGGVQLRKKQTRIFTFTELIL